MPPEPTPRPNDIPEETWSAALSLLEGDAVRLVQSYVGNAAGLLVGIEDLAQEVRVAFLKSLSSFEQRTSDLNGDLRALLATIVKHQVQNARKAARSAAEKVEQAAAEQTKTSGQSVHRVVSHDQAVTFVMSELDKLSSQERQIVRLRFEHNMSFVDIGTALGVPEYAVRRQLDRTLDHLREVMSSSGKWTLTRDGESR